MINSTGSEGKVKNTKPYYIYKANKNNTGAALQVDLNIKKGAVFLECANQRSEDRFDWENKVTIKLSSSDIGQILEVLEGHTQTIKLFHQPSKGEYKTAQNVKNVALTFTSNTRGYNLTVSQQTTNGIKRVSINISKAEGIVLRILLSSAIKKIYGW